MYIGVLFSPNLASQSPCLFKLQYIFKLLSWKSFTAHLGNFIYLYLLVILGSFLLFFEI